ncbi:hypothetical protein HanRHA438_Chr12g0570961 [Helianthus annuus]|nr:hypothetical protein HanRHA438_Chr12g0570961 [Helianthus annuus]
MEDIFKSSLSDPWCHVNSPVPDNSSSNLNSVMRFLEEHCSNINFLPHPWLSLIPLQRLYTGLYDIERVKDRCSIMK